MPVSKRTRYEVLRRDNHTCRYCGESAPDVKLTVDHVTPVALGGTDDPDNLVAACRDCNYVADNWRGSIERFYDLGVPPEDIADCVRIALTNSRIHYDDAYRYFAGCVWRVVTEMQEAAKELLAGEEGA